LIVGHGRPTGAAGSISIPGQSSRSASPARHRQDDGGTGVATVNRHYFNLEDDLMQKIIDGWAVPDLEVFAPDLEPVALMPRRTTMRPPLPSSRRRVART
jgi:hypothetical protein